MSKNMNGLDWYCIITVSLTVIAGCLLFLAWMAWRKDQRDVLVTDKLVENQNLLNQTKEAINLNHNVISDQLIVNNQELKKSNKELNTLVRILSNNQVLRQMVRNSREEEQKMHTSSINYQETASTKSYQNLLINLASASKNNEQIVEEDDRYTNNNSHK